MHFYSSTATSTGSRWNYCEAFPSLPRLKQEHFGTQRRVCVSSPVLKVSLQNLRCLCGTLPWGIQGGFSHVSSADALISKGSTQEDYGWDNIIKFV